MPNGIFGGTLLKITESILQTCCLLNTSCVLPIFNNVANNTGYLGKKYDGLGQHHGGGGGGENALWPSITSEHWKVSQQKVTGYDDANYGTETTTIAAVSEKVCCYILILIRKLWKVLCLSHCSLCLGLFVVILVVLSLLLLW